MNLKSLLIALPLTALLASATDATVSGLSIRQRWPWSQKVDVTYTLNADSNEWVDIEFYAGGSKLSIPDTALSGNHQFVSPNGIHTITLDPLKTQYTNCVLSNLRAKLKVSASPLYMLVDLSKEPSDAGQITYLTAYDITNSASTYGTWEWGNTYHTGTYIDSRWQNTIVWTGVTNDLKYATNYLVLRYVPAGVYTQGVATNDVDYRSDMSRQGPREVTLTHPFFVGVFPVTRGQAALIFGEDKANTINSPQLGSPFTVAGSSSSFALFRNTGTCDIASDSLVGILQQKTGLDFDLPTEAQWEYACRAGTTSSWNNGTRCTSTNKDDSNLALLGWYRQSGVLDVVGQKQPNGWGLYEMHGSVLEFCVDFWKYGESTAAVTNPVVTYQAAYNKAFRVVKGGREIDYVWGYPVFWLTSGWRVNSCNESSLNESDLGCRLFYTLP